MLLERLLRARKDREADLSAWSSYPDDLPDLAALRPPGGNALAFRAVNNEGEDVVVAVIELVSPPNKDRPESREAFVAKCLSYLRVGVSVIIIDVATERHASYHRDISAALSLSGPAREAAPADLYAVAYLATGDGGRRRLRAWPFTLAAGATLPKIPLWLTAALAVPIDLETSYMEACRQLRLPLTSARTAPAGS